MSNFMKEGAKGSEKLISIRTKEVAPSIAMKTSFLVVEMAVVSEFIF